MKKLYSGKKYIKWKSTAAEKSLRSKPIRKIRLEAYKAGMVTNTRWADYRPIEAPADFRLRDNTTECLNFFNSIRNPKNHYYHQTYKQHFVGLELKHVTEIDYCSVSVLKALMEELEPQKINVQGSSPTDPNCRNFLVTSGFYDGLSDLNNKEIHLKGNSDRVMFTKGSGRLSDSEDASVVAILRKIRKHLTGNEGHCPQLRTIILEICGNSIEHSESYNKQWVFGVKYEPEKVIITMTDTGKGILKTLFRRFGRKAADFLSKTTVEILEGAFDKKYQSKTLDKNRNKGLPAIKKAFENGHIKDLLVITNDVLLNFGDSKKSYDFPLGIGFDGTLFQMELTKSCFNGNK